ncbi:MAG TPA: hypothetical protein VFR92_11200 [Sphingomicrobium sp.]|nr:hypothetical protein [Sphingomicrobium sp.]
MGLLATDPQSYARAVKSLCPSRFCSAHNPVQELVTRRQAELVDETALEGTVRCSSCGCVWVSGPAGAPRILGNLHRIGRGYEWRSPYKCETPL